MTTQANNNVNKKRALQVIAREETEDAIVEVIQYSILRGSDDVRTAETLVYTAQAGMRMKMVRITLKDSKVRVEPGALYFMKGDLEMKASTGGGLMKGLARKLTSGESLFVNEIEGTGVIYLEPTFGHFFLHRIEEDSPGVICDKSMFYAGTTHLDISSSMQKNISSMMFGGEGLFQTSIKGSGIAVLFSPVPLQEVQKIQLNDEKLSVDGNFALMRSAGLEFKAEKSSKSWLATSVSGEGLLQTFSGTGTVWVAPTQGMYDKLASMSRMKELVGPQKNRDNHTDIEEAVD